MRHEHEYCCSYGRSIELLDRFLRKENDDNLIQVNSGFEEEIKRDDDEIFVVLGQE